MTLKTLQILQVFLRSANDEMSGYQIFKAINVQSGTLYPVLKRFETVGWLSSRWEDIDASVEGRPRKRLYKLTAQGRRCAMEQLESHFGSGVLQGC